MSLQQINLARQWFDHAQDTAPAGYLEREDYVLAAALYQALLVRVPHSVLKGAGLPLPEILSEG